MNCRLNQNLARYPYSPSGCCISETSHAQLSVPCADKTGGVLGNSTSSLSRETLLQLWLDSIKSFRSFILPSVRPFVPPWALEFCCCIYLSFECNDAFTEMHKCCINSHSLFKFTTNRHQRIVYGFNILPSQTCLYKCELYLFQQR